MDLASPAPQVKGGSGSIAEGEGEGAKLGGGVSLVPSAPPAHLSLAAVLGGDGDLLSLEPPAWLPDSHAAACARCRAPFRCAHALLLLAACACCCMLLLALFLGARGWDVSAPWLGCLCAAGMPAC
jgi:hypothetical protein